MSAALRSYRAARSVLLYAFICAISLSYGFMDWGLYREKFITNPDGWKLYFRGGVEAPWQYRIGIWMAVDWLNRHFSMKAYDTLTLIDVVCLTAALWAVLQVLRNSDEYRALPDPTRWLSVTGMLFLAEYYLGWGHWYQTGVTLPSVLFVALSMAIVYGRIVKSRLLASFLLLALAYVQGFIRADVAVLLHAGFVVALLFRARFPLFLGKFGQMATSGVAALVAGCIQLYLMLVRFPNAKYGPGGVVRLSTNIHPGMWLTLLLATFPCWLLIGLVAVRRYRADGETGMLLIASLLYLAVWATVGLLDEVRIFLPFAFALMPATVMALVGLLPTKMVSSGEAPAT